MPVPAVQCPLFPGGASWTHSCLCPIPLVLTEPWASIPLPFFKLQGFLSISSLDPTLFSLKSSLSVFSYTLGNWSWTEQKQYSPCDMGWQHRLLLICCGRGPGAEHLTQASVFTLPVTVARGWDCSGVISIVWMERLTHKGKVTFFRPPLYSYHLFSISNCTNQRQSSTMKKKKEGLEHRLKLGSDSV